MSKKMIIIIAIILILVIVIVGMFLFFKFRNSEPEEKEPEKFTMTTEDMYSNIKDSKKIVKIRITVETIDEDLLLELQEKEFLVRDISNKIIRNQIEENLEGNNGQVKLQNDIKEELSQTFNTESITDVYFDDFVIQ